MTETTRVGQSTTAHFEEKAKAAEEGENIVKRALPADDMDIDMETEEEILAQKTLMDSMEPEAHVNTILATDFQHPGQFADPELAEALCRMALSDTSSWDEVDGYTDKSNDTAQDWTMVHPDRWFVAWRSVVRRS